MSTIDYSQLGNLRLAAMIENEVRAVLADMASIRNTGALLFAGDVAGIGSKVMRMRYADWGANTPFASATDGADVASATLTPSTVDITVGRSALRYDITDLAAMTGLGIDIDPFTIAQKMAMSAEARINQIICATFTAASNSVGTSGVDMSVDDFYDAMFQLESESNNGEFYCILHPQQLSDLRDSLRSESNNALAFSPATEDMLAIKGQGFAGRFGGVDIFKSSYVNEVTGDKVGAMMSRGGIAYAVGTPRPLAGAGVEIRPAGTPVVVAFQRDESKGLTEVMGHLYCGAAITEDARIVKIVTDA
jgi:hypothetical protein